MEGYPIAWISWRGMIVTELGASSTASAVRDAASTSSICRSSGARRVCSLLRTSTVCSMVRKPEREMRTRRWPTGTLTTTGVKPEGWPSTSTRASRSSVLTTRVPVRGVRRGRAVTVSRARTSTSCSLVA